jgi:hypothetical protein
MITFDPSRIDTASVLLGAFAWWFWSKYIFQGICIWIIIPLGSIMTNKSRESVIIAGMESAKKRLDTLLPYWTVKQ